MSFESAGPSIVKSIKQRDMLNLWLRLYARRNQQMPRLADFQPDRIEDEKRDMVFYRVQHEADRIRFVIQSEGTRLGDAYGTPGKGRYLDEYIGPKLVPSIMPIYHESAQRGLPVYSISMVKDLYGRSVAYERLLLPFSDGDRISDLVASLKTISEDGGFEIKNLMRGHDMTPEFKIRATIDRDLMHRMPGRIQAGDVIEFG